MKPKRHQNHILENESNKFFNNHLPLSWFVDKPENDYGIDYITNIVINNEVTGLYFSVQLKAKEFDSNTESVNIQFKTSTLNFYKSRLEPVLIVAFVRQEKEAYWTWFDNLELCEESLANKETYYVKVPKINKLTTTDWSLVTKKVQQNASIKYLIEEFSRLDYENLDQSEILAWKNYFLKNHTDSIFFFKKSLEKDIPNNKNLLLQGIAHSLYEMFNYNEALIYINKSIDIDPSKSAYLMKACILAEQGISTYNKSKLLSAKEIFKNFLDSEPNKPIYHFNYANTLQHLQEYNLAIEHFEIAIKLNPKYAEAWNNLGMIYYHLHDHDKEIQCYDKAIEIKPNLYQALFSKGVTYSLIYNRYDEGLELMLNSIKTNEDDLLSSFPRGYYYIAQTYYKKNDFLKALSYIDKGLDYISDDNYLINLKLSIIDENLQKQFIDNNYFNSFLNVILSLNDVRAIYYLALNNNLNENEIIKILNENLYLFSSIELKDLAKCKIDLKESIIFLKYYITYNNFRSKYPVLSYLENLSSNHYEIPNLFFTLFEFSAAISFSNAIQYILQNENVEPIQINQIIREHLSRLPLLINILIPEYCSNLLKNQKIEIFSNLIIEFRLVVLREIARQQGHLLGLFSLDNIEIDDSTFPQSYLNKIVDEVMEIANNKLRLLPKE